MNPLPNDNTTRKLKHNIFTSSIYMLPNPKTLEIYIAHIGFWHEYLWGRKIVNGFLHTGSVCPYYAPWHIGMAVMKILKLTILL